MIAQQSGARASVNLVICAIAAVAALLLAWSSAGSAAETPGPSMSAPGVKVALIIANSSYAAEAVLKTPSADARLVASSLRAVGFQTVTIVENAGKADMEKALQAFAAAADQADVAVVYFAGHGLEIGGTNYLLPVDARPRFERDVEVQSVKLDTVLTMTQGARRLRLVLVDACRNNPFLDSMQGSQGHRGAATRGLAPIEPQADSLVVYAAKAGSQAIDDVGGNSPFAKAVARSVVEPGREIGLMFRDVRDDVLEATNGQQEPFTYGSLSRHEFYFIPPVASTSGGASADVELEAWALCRSGATRSPCDAYLRAYPAGRFAAFAQARIADLQAPPPVVIPVVSTPLTVEGLGFSVLDVGASGGVQVQTIDPTSPASNELFPGDEIIRVGASTPRNASLAAAQISTAFEQQGRVQLVVKRGPTTTMVILRSQ